MNIVSHAFDPAVINYYSAPPFDPPILYPELKHVKRTAPDNLVYGQVRQLLINLAMDAGRIGTPEWNPFGEIVKPGDNVLIKPNLVTHCHYLGSDSLYSSIIHGSVLRPLVDYISLALKGEGTITIADNPVEGADFNEIMKFTGIAEMCEMLAIEGYKGLSVIDLRPQVMKEASDGRFYHERQTGDPLGYVNVDLGKNSCFADLDGNAAIHYYTLADPTIDHLDPKCIRKSKTDTFHNAAGHKYLVSKTVLNSDVLISVSKMKTHCKAGVSMSLKNMIGMIYLKECMPHHRPGSPPDGDSFPTSPASHYVASRKIYRRLRKLVGIHKFPFFRPARDYLQKNKILLGKHIEHGNWKGNDTIWRTILDINRIAIYADSNGVMRDNKQRCYFSMVDGIISQQGDGPMNGEPVATSLLVGGLNPVAVDALALKAMGIPMALIRSLSRAGDINKYPLVPDGGFDLSFSEYPVQSRPFRMPVGWE